MDITARERKTLVINIEGQGQYTVPLPASLAPTDMAGFVKAKKEGEQETYLWLVDFFARYIGDAMESITNDDFREIVRTWDHGGEPSMGESPASSSS